MQRCHCSPSKQKCLKWNEQYNKGYLSREKSTSHKCTRRENYPKKGRIIPIKCIGQGVGGEWEEGGGGKGDTTPFPNRWLIEWVKLGWQHKKYGQQATVKCTLKQKETKLFFYKTHTKWWGQYFFTGETSALLSCYKQHWCIQCKRFKFLKKPKNLTC